jgi:hypothetical protein
METIEAGFDSVNKFIRPAVETIQTAKGEQEALGELEDSGPQFELQPTGDAMGAVPAIPGGKSQPPLQPGPTQAKADSLGLKTKSGAFNWQAFVTEGGARPDAIIGLNHEFRGGLERMIAEAPPEIQAGIKIGSAYRSNERQAELFAAAVAKYGSEAAARKWVAPPGKSKHNSGQAVDLKYASPEVKAYFHENAARYGMHFPMSWEDWHIEPLGARGGGDTEVVSRMPNGGMNDYELRAINGKTFEPRLPFTVRDAAFNATADKVISARATEALETGMMLAQQKANGDLGILRTEMEKVRNEVMATLPKELPGLATDLNAIYTRGAGAAERQALDLKQRQKIAETTAAMTTQASNLKAEVERLALTGAGSGAISAALASGQEALAAYGPREGFTVNGKTYGPDPTRAGVMTPGDIATGIAALGQDAHRIMLEAEFMKSAAPGQFVEEFRKQVFSGNSPLGVGESLKLLSELQGRANSAESARRTAANAERDRLQKEYKDRINPYVSMTEQGVPVAIPPQERERILSSLAPYPELQREAALEFAVADAAVATHGMRGAEVIAYADTIREDLAAAAAAGEIDLAAVAVLESLEDRVKKAQDAITAEMIGLPMVEQLALDGATADQINWDGLRAEANGNQEVLDQIAVTEAFYRDIESLEGMTADEREAALAEARARQGELAAMGGGYGAAALQTEKVLNKLTGWSEKRASLAANDSMAFARSAGVALPGLDGARSMTDVGKVLAERVGLLAPLTASEGVRHPVPLEPFEIAALSEVYRESSRAEQTAFLAQISDLGQDQAEAIFAKIGQSEPLLFAAGTIYAGGNHEAAAVILRGSSDSKLVGGSPEEISAARTTVIGGLLEADMIDSGSISAIDAAAAAYARGKALSEGGRAMTQDDFLRGYEVAMGGQEDGTGGVQHTRFGTTVLPPGWDAYKIDVILGKMNTEQMQVFAGGKVEDRQGRPYTARELQETMEQLVLDPENPKILIPRDADGGYFVVNKGGQREILTFDLGAME